MPAGGAAGLLRRRAGRSSLPPSVAAPLCADGAVHALPVAVGDDPRLRPVRHRATAPDVGARPDGRLRVDAAPAGADCAAAGAPAADPPIITLAIVALRSYSDAATLNAD